MGLEECAAAPDCMRSRKYETKEKSEYLKTWRDKIINLQREEGVGK